MKSPAWQVFTLIISAFLLTPLMSGAQYYYKDIWNLGQLKADFKIIKEEKIKIVSIKSFENTGEASDGFRCEKKIKGDYSQSQMMSKSNITGESVLVTNYNSTGQIISTTDNTPTTTSSTEYKYDDSGRLSTVKITATADGDTSSIIETRDYQYDDASLPAQMVRKKNGTVVSNISFLKDEQGNIIAENVRDTRTTDRKYYYYYDKENRLTDVVHFNDLAGKLLPDYIYEYTDTAFPSQMISASESGNNYFIWRYNYNEKNLRESEICYSKDKRMLGRIVYEYR